jgi:hypothetical protein
MALRSCRICGETGIPSEQFAGHKAAHLAEMKARAARPSRTLRPCYVCPRTADGKMALVLASEMEHHRATVHPSAAGIYRSSGAWKRLRAARLSIDGYRCQGCGSTENLEVHHRRGMASQDVGDLITLCRTCHPRPYLG